MRGRGRSVPRSGPARYAGYRRGGQPGHHQQGRGRAGGERCGGALGPAAPAAVADGLLHELERHRRQHRDDGESHRVERPTVQAGATLVQEHDHGPVEEVDAVGGAAQHAQGGQTGDGAERPGTAGGAGHREHAEDRGDGEAARGTSTRPRRARGRPWRRDPRDRPCRRRLQRRRATLGACRTGGPRQDRRAARPGGGPARACGSRGRRPRGLVVRTIAMADAATSTPTAAAERCAAAAVSR